MKIKYYKKITDKGIQKDLYDLLALCDKEFVPPLSARSSTTQADLKGGSTSAGVDAYFSEVLKQSALVVVNDGKVVGFMTFKKDYVCENISPEYLPNLYVTTVIVHPDFRHHGIAGKFYKKLIALFPQYYIFTRTWSTNTSHTRILKSMSFNEHCYLVGDRGEGIDTVYYRFKSKKQSLGDYISQYRLGGNIFFSVLLLLFSIAFVFAWLYASDETTRELSLAISTSLMASLLCLLSDTYLKIRESRNDMFITRLKEFGIKNVHFNKNEILESIIPNCRKEIWISGYRLIMTSKPSFCNALTLACKRSKNLNIKILVVPPWSVTYKHTYGNEDVSVNYLTVLHDLCECVEKEGLRLEMRFADHPLFSDTYKVDERFITGPYLNCTDRYKDRITAKDFFSFDVISEEKELYKIIYDDYMTVWEEADSILNVKLMCQKLKTIGSIRAMSKEERENLLIECSVPIDKQNET